MVSDRHQALFAQSETKKSNNPFSSLHFSRAVSHDMPSSAAALQVATVTKANLAGKIASRQNSLTFPWHEHNAQRHEGPQSQHALPTVLKIHPITCTIFWATSNLATFHQTVRVATLHTPLVPTIWTRHQSVDSQHAHTRIFSDSLASTSGGTHNGHNNDDHNPQRVKQRFVTLLD